MPCPIRTPPCQVLHGALELPWWHCVVLNNPGSSDGVITDSTIRRAMQRAGVAMSPHGFRSTLRIWAQKRGENQAAEISLRRIGSSAVARYARSGILEMRRVLMERYAGGKEPDNGFRGLDDGGGLRPPQRAAGEGSGGGRWRRASSERQLGASVTLMGAAVTGLCALGEVPLPLSFPRSGRGIHVLRTRC